MKYLCTVFVFLLGPAKAVDPHYSFLKAFRKLDEYYYADDYYYEVFLEECPCLQDTQIVIEDIEGNQALIQALEDITDNVLFSSNTLILNESSSEPFLSNFDDICTAAKGMTVLTDVNVDIEGCANAPYSYRGYPICIANSCGGTQNDIKSTKAVIKDMTYQGLDLAFDESCLPEVSFGFYSSPPSYSCGQNDTGGSDDTSDTDLFETLLSLGKSESCVSDMLTMLGEPSFLFDKAVETLYELQQDSSNTITYRFNENATALYQYSEECTLYKGGVALLDIALDSECEAEVTFDRVPVCIPISCNSDKDNEAESILKVVFQEDSDTCGVDVSIVGTLTPGRKKKTKNNITPTKSSSKVIQMKKKKSKSEELVANKSEDLKCVADMAKIHGNELGMNPYSKREDLLENLVECSPSTDLNPICFFNGNDDALAQYTSECSNMGGRVVRTEWLFADGCDEMDEDWIDWIGVHDCVASTCSDMGAADFFNTVYFDPENTSCYADISIVNIMPARKKKKSAKSAKALRKK